MFIFFLPQCAGTRSAVRDGDGGEQVEVLHHHSDPQDLRRGVRVHAGHDQQGLRGAPGAQNQLLHSPAGRERPLLPRLPEHTPAAVQTSLGLDHLGVQAHDEERGGHWSFNPLPAASECLLTP